MFSLRSNTSKPGRYAEKRIMIKLLIIILIITTSCQSHQLLEFKISGIHKDTLIELINETVNHEHNTDQESCIKEYFTELGIVITQVDINDHSIVLMTDKQNYITLEQALYPYTNEHEN